MADGGEVLLRGRRVPVVGQVSMDYTTLDISSVPGARVGDVVTLIGTDGGTRISVEEVARQCRTIPYDVLCGLGRRIVRLPVGSRTPVA
jgi:alanine racemase